MSTLVQYQQITSLPYPIVAAADEKGLCALHFLNENNADMYLQNLALKNNWELQNIHTDILEITAQELQSYFAGKLKTFSIPLSFYGTTFQQNVWQGLLQIPYGETRGYTKQTAVLGNPQAIRAVASANGKNPIAIVVPCHRVIGTNGKMTGYAGGIDKKIFLIQLEKNNSPAKNTLF